MSRTYRKPLRLIEENEDTYIKRQLDSRYRRWNKGDNYRTKYVRRKKPEDQYKAECQVALNEYQEKLKTAEYDEYGRPYVWRYGWNWCNRERTVYADYIHRPCVSRYHRVDIPWSIEQEIEDLKTQYRKFTRDGHWNETGCNTGFKEAAAKVTRLGNRRLEKKILKDEDYDHLPYPNEHDGDHLAWSFW
jgi:hypothetical protein